MSDDNNRSNPIESLINFILFLGFLWLVVKLITLIIGSLIACVRGICNYIGAKREDHKRSEEKKRELEERFSNKDYFQSELKKLSEDKSKLVLDSCEPFVSSEALHRLNADESKHVISICKLLEEAREELAEWSSKENNYNKAIKLRYLQSQVDRLSDELKQTLSVIANCPAVSDLS